MMHRTSLLEDYNRSMRRRLGRESLTEKLDAIRQGGGFRCGVSSGQQQQSVQPVTAANEQHPVQLSMFE
jgi:hypothetical protein